MNEDKNIEWKESWKDEYLKWICGFANAQGGVLEIGRNDIGKIVGVNNVLKLLKDLPNKIRDILGILPEIDHIKEQEKSFIRIKIKPYKYPINYKGSFYYRSGSTNQELKGPTLNQFLLEKTGETWDSITIEDNSIISDLSNDTITRFREMAVKKERLHPEVLKESENDLIEQLRLKSGAQCKRATILLFHPHPEYYFTGAYIKIGYFTNSAEILYQDIIYGDLFTQVEKAMDILLTKYLKALISYRGLERLETYPVPKEALREALLNAVTHRDYSTGIPIQIKVYKDKIIFWNNRQFPDNWTVEELLSTHLSDPFNPNIARIFFLSGMVESWGRGIDKMITECKKSGVSIPIFQKKNNGLLVEFKNHGDSIDKIIGQSVKSTKTGEKTAKTGEKTVKTGEKTVKTGEKTVKTGEKVLNLIAINPKITTEVLSHKINITKSGVEWQINELKRAGLLKRIGPDKGGYWETKNMVDLSFINKNCNNRYEKHIKNLERKGLETTNIKETIENTITNLNNSKSFIIYGEPQSGKTEMMIALTAKLLDKGHKIIIILLNDSISLLNQNLERFSLSQLSPTPKNFTEILKPEIKIGDKQWVIFSKKNAKDLRKLKDKLKNKKSFVIIDDEADYATPNAKINRTEKTKINKLIGEFIDKDGLYIGVTATPARLDLNNTFDNDKDKWVCFEPHSLYKGHKTFFPQDIKHLEEGKGDFRLKSLRNETGNDLQPLREALFSFLINVAYLNLYNQKTRNEKNYSFLIHTSGKKSDHETDEKIINNIFNILTEINTSDKKNKYYHQIYSLAEDRFTTEKGKEITKYISENADKYRVVVMNSDQEKSFRNNKMATQPVTLFTVIIGGNIVSRGVTFENLLSMFFTRGVKHKMQQDTYIQRARMFGNRSEYLKYFELTIPEKLYIDWHQCFLFHTLALESIKTNQGAPIWIESSSNRPVATGSIDKANLQFNQREIRFALFQYDPEIESIIKDSNDPFSTLNILQERIGKVALPTYLINFIQQYSSSPDEVVIHPSASIKKWKDADKEKISRPKGFIGNADIQKDRYPRAKHHIKIYFCDQKARICYKNIAPERIKFLSVRNNT